MRRWTVTLRSPASVTETSWFVIRCPCGVENEEVRGAVAMSGDDQRFVVEDGGVGDGGIADDDRRSGLRHGDHGGLIDLDRDRLGRCAAPAQAASSRGSSAAKRRAEAVLERRGTQRHEPLRRIDVRQFCGA